MSDLLRTAASLARNERRQAQVVFTLIWASLIGLVVFAPFHAG